jgi:hypothetical protein
MRVRHLVILALIALFSVLLRAQGGAKPAPGQSVPVGAFSGSAKDLVTPQAAAWSKFTAKRVGLNRTPPLFDTDEPSTAELSVVEVRAARAADGLVVQLSWRDPTNDAAALAKVPDSPPETRFHKVPTEADDRFFDAAAIMFPSKHQTGPAAPSLQMGDTADPVEIYYWNPARGAMLIQAQGRGTTRRTGQAFPAAGVYERGQWTVTLELPSLPAGTPVAFAVWNGSQKDRDGRKYFSVWQVLE